MNICLPYTHYINDIFRCLFHDIGVPFTPAPVPGKYTKEIGVTFANGTLCEGLAEALGSLCECAYLGADTALIFTPCGTCSEQRIRQKLANCLEENGVALQLICFCAYSEGNKAFFAWLKENTGCSLFAFYEAKRLFFECTKSLEQFLHFKHSGAVSETLNAYMEAAEKELAGANSLLRIKVLLNVFNKKLTSFSVIGNSFENGRREVPYATGDYFALAQTGSFFGFFEKPAHALFGKTNSNVTHCEQICRRQKATNK